MATGNKIIITLNRAPASMAKVFTSSLTTTFIWETGERTNSTDLACLSLGMEMCFEGSSKMERSSKVSLYIQKEMFTKGTLKMGFSMAMAKWNTEGNHKQSITKQGRVDLNRSMLDNGKKGRNTEKALTNPKSTQ
jgi:hypothetical protein